MEQNLIQGERNCVCAMRTTEFMGRPDPIHLGWRLESIESRSGGCDRDQQLRQGRGDLKFCMRADGDFGPRGGVVMKKLGVAVAIAIASVGAAHAADLPTKKEAPPPPPNCFSSVWAYMNSTAADCPLTWGPFTAYATLDLGLGYESNGAAWNNSY